MHRRHHDNENRRSTHRASAPTAHTASEAKVQPEDKHFDAPHARIVEPLPEKEKHDQLAEKVECSESRQEALLDEGLEESFPASDPVSVKRIT